MNNVKTAKQKTKKTDLTLQILIVEDDLVDRTQLERLLLRSKLHVKTITTESLDKALELLKNNKIDIMLLDLNLPDSNGLNTLLTVAKQQSGAAIVVITGGGGEEMGLQAVAAGAHDYLVKGEFDTQGLSKSIRYSIERKRAEEELHFKNAVLETQQHVSPDGILVVDENQKIISFNSRFVEICEIPEEILATHNDKQVLDNVLSRIKNPEEFLSRIQYLYEHKTENSRDEIVLKSGRTIERYSAPMTSKKGNYYGRVWYFHDITERKKAEAALKQSEARYRSFIEVTDQVAWVTNARGEVVEDIPSWRKFTGQSYEEIKGDGWAKALHPDDIEQTLKVWNNAVAEKTNYETEYRMRRHDGVYRNLLARGFPVTDKNGIVKEWVGTCIDITERKKIESALWESQEQYQSLINNSVMGVAVIDTGHRIIKVNTTFATMFKKPADKFTGKFCFNEFEKRDAICVHCPGARSMVSGKTEEVETQGVRDDGSKFYVRNRAVPLFRHDGTIHGFIEMVEDIEVRKKAEEALQRERNKAKKYLDVAGVMMVVLDDGKTIHRINNKGCEILGYSEEELIGKNWSENFVPPEYRKDVEELLKGLMSGNIEKYEYHENPVITKSGQQRLIAWHNVVLWDESKNIHAVLSSGEDITERKAAEIELLGAYKKLEKAHSDMKNMQSQLVQNEKLASIGQLAAGVAHEMNTPVGFVASNFETLEKYLSKFKTLLDMYAKMGVEISTADKEQLIAKYEEIKKAAKDLKIDFVLEDIDALFKESKEGLTRVTTIIQNLRDFSRIDQAEAFDEFDVNNGIEATLAVARNTIKYHSNVATEFADIPHVPCNASQINQVFLNIIVNAAQAIESQRRTEMGNIKIKTTATDTHVVCRIEDDGPGIPQEYIDKVFDPFFTTKPAGKGTGLGLAVSRDIIVNKHKGELIVESTVGKGAKFTIKLPLKTTKPQDDNKKQLPAEAGANVV